MTMIVNPSGWSKRRAKARKKRSIWKDPERVDIREARRAIAEQQNEGERGEPVLETREEMIAELRAAGKRVPPKIKDETLQKKIEELRGVDPR